MVQGEGVMLYFQVDEKKKQCYFWAYGADRLEEYQREGFQDISERYRKEGYEVTLFIGGEKPLLPVMKELFHAQEKIRNSDTIEAS